MIDSLVTVPAETRDRNGDGDNVPVDSRRLKLALMGALDFLGDDDIHYVLFDLEQNGIALNDEFLYYSLKQIEGKLSNLFGPDASIMIMQRLRSSL